MQKLIFNFKHKPYLTDLKTILSELFYESIIQNEQFQRQIKKGEWILAPIPLSEARLRKRGYNQAQILAEELSQKLNFPMQNLLERTRETKTQGGLTTSQRKLNIKNAFKLKIEDVKHKNIFLVDDVVTTGSTLLEAARVLKRGGVQKVFGLTLARD